jgi:hypothetical protein
MANAATAAGYGALEAQCAVLHSAEETSSATPLGNRRLALRFAEEVRRTGVSACRAKPVGMVMKRVSRPVLAAGKQIAVGRIASGGLELCLAL